MLAHLLSVLLCLDVLRVQCEHNPAITSISANQQKFVGETVHMHCTISHPHPSMVVIWLKDINVLTTNELIISGDNRLSIRNFPGSYNYNLTIKHLQESDSGDYECRVQFRTEQLSNFTRLIVSEKEVSFVPKFQSKPQNFTVKQGQDVTLPCDLDKLGDAYVLLWKKETTVLTASRLRITHNERLELLSNLNLKISSIQPEDAGVYICQISTKEPMELRHIVQLETSPTTKIVTMAHDRVTEVVKLEGDELKLICEVTGIPYPNLTWTKRKPHSNEEEFLTSTSLLHIPKVTRKNAGHYTCEADNNVGAISKSSVELYIQFAPKVLEADDQIFSALGLNTKLNCKFEVFPSANLTWLLNGKKLDRSLHYEISDDMIENGKYMLSLTIHNVTENDFGKYTCLGSNRFGTSNASIELTGKPSTVKLRKGKTSVRPTSFHIDWAVISYLPIQTYKLRLRKIDKTLKTQGQWISKEIDAENQEGSEQQQTYNISDLEPSTTYQVIMNAKNQFGLSTDSNILEFTTAALKAQPESEPRPEIDVGEVKPEQSQQPGTTPSGQAVNWPQSYLTIGMLIAICIF